MADEIYHGRNTQLLAEFEPNFRTLPTTPNMRQYKISEIDLDRKPDRVEDPTLRGAALMEKRDEVDSSPAGTIKAILCLNEIGFWLKALLGQPVTTGTGPYTHTFTLTLNDQPSMVMELVQKRLGGQRISRYLGAMLSQFSWNGVQNDQSWSGQLVIGTEVRPSPTVVLDTNTAGFTKARACGRKGILYDVLGASTLGRITDFEMEIDKGLDPQKLADGLEGYGVVLQGQPKVSGSIKCLFEDGTVFDAARAHATKRLVFDTTSNGTETLRVVLPSVEFDEPSNKINSSKGMIADVKWMAHQDPTNPVQIILSNSIASY